MQNAERKTEGLRSLLLRIAFCVLTSAFIFLPGCHPSDPRAGLRATQADLETATPAYWMEKPVTSTIEHSDFEKLWRACRQATIDSSYVMDRVDFRTGRMSTIPLVSKQVFELWRNDVTADALAESSLSTMRRTVWWDIEKLDNGTFRASPKVLVERYVMEERRLTTAMQYQEIFSGEHMVQGTKLEDQDRDALIPDEYWYAVGRDGPLEQRLINSVAAKLK